MSGIGSLRLSSPVQLRSSSPVQVRRHTTPMVVSGSVMQKPMSLSMVSISSPVPPSPVQAVARVAPTNIEPAPQMVRVWPAEPAADWRNDFMFLRQEIDQLRENDRWQIQQIQQLEQQVGADLVPSVSHRLTLLENNSGRDLDASWMPKMQQAENKISEMIKRLALLESENQIVDNRVTVLEASPWMPKLQQAENQISNMIIALNELVIRVEDLEKTPPVVEVENSQMELERKVQEIEAHGNVRFDLATGNMQVLREIAFVPIKSSDKPVATLRDPQTAAEVIDDIAAVGALFENNILTIEGHTGGGESDYWQRLADDRARLVGEEIVQRGHRSDTLRTVGRPGKRGLNKSEVVVKLKMNADQIEELRRGSIEVDEMRRGSH